MMACLQAGEQGFCIYSVQRLSKKKTLRYIEAAQTVVSGSIWTPKHHDVTFTTLITDQIFPSHSTTEPQGLNKKVKGVKLNTKSNNIYLAYYYPFRLVLVGQLNAYKSAWLSGSVSDFLIRRGKTINNLIYGSEPTLLKENILATVSLNVSVTLSLL